MEVPVTLSMLYRQRERWAKGGTEVWLTNLKKVFSHPFKNLGQTVMFMDQTLSIIWSIFFCISSIIFLLIVGKALIQGSEVTIYRTFTVSFIFICFEMLAGILQLVTSLSVDDQGRKMKYLFFAPLHMLLFWVVNAITIVTTFIPAVKTILGYGSGVWVQQNLETMVMMIKKERILLNILSHHIRTYSSNTLSPITRSRVIGYFYSIINFIKSSTIFLERQ